MQGKTVKTALPRVQPAGIAKYINRWTLLGAALLCWYVYANVGEWINWVQLRTYSPSSEWQPLEIADPCERVALGMDYALAIDQEGDVYAWGMSSKGQLGFVVEPKKHGSTQQETPRKVPLPGKAKCIATGNYYVVALMEDGSIWHWGDIGPDYPGGWQAENPNRSFEPKKFLDFPGVVSVSVHWRGGMLLTDSGEVYEWGAADAGYGNVKEGPYRWEPEKVEIPADVRWLQSGGARKLAISSDKKVFAWGSVGPDVEQPGRAIYSKNVVELALPMPIVDVTNGGSYMHFLDPAGQVWGWGTDTRTFSDHRHSYFKVPTPISTLRGIVDIETALLRSDYAVRRDRKLIGWGEKYFATPPQSGPSSAPPQLVDIPFQIRRVYARSRDRIVEDRSGCLWATMRWASRLRLHYQTEGAPSGITAKERAAWLEERAKHPEFKRGAKLRLGKYYRIPIYRPDGQQICNPVNSSIVEE